MKKRKFMICLLSDHCIVRLSLKMNKRRKKRENTEIQKNEQGRMNNYKKEVKDRLTEKEEVDNNDNK